MESGTPQCDHIFSVGYLGNW